MAEGERAKGRGRGKGDGKGQVNKGNAATKKSEVHECVYRYRRTR